MNIRLLILLFLLGYSQTQSLANNCIAKNSYITFGDLFTLKYTAYPDSVKDHVWTIGFITQGEGCEDLYANNRMRLHLTSFDHVNYISKTPWLSNLYEYTYDTPTQGYKVIGAKSGDKYIRRSYQFRITDRDIYSYGFWQISLDGVLNGQRFQFPDLHKYLHHNTEKLRIFVVADMDDTENSKATIQKMISIKDWYDIVIHNGDFAYNIEDDIGMRGDDFFESVREAVSTKPYLVNPGNHENIDQGRFFNYRFRMPGLHNNQLAIRNQYYSLDIRKTHFTFFNMDWFLHIRNNLQTKIDLVKWVHDDLEKSHQFDLMFRVAFTHRPIVCGEPGNIECNFKLYIYKPFEDILRKHQVDLVIQAHMHDYTRLFKMYNFTDLQTSTLPVKSKAYISPTYVVSGHSGNESYFPETNRLKQVSKLNQRYITGRNPNFLQVEINYKEIIASLHDCKTEEIQDFFMIVSRNVNAIMFGYTPGFSFAVWKLAFWIVIAFLIV